MRVSATLFYGLSHTGLTLDDLVKSCRRDVGECSHLIEVGAYSGCSCEDADHFHTEDDRLCQAPPCSIRIANLPQDRFL